MTYPARHSIFLVLILAVSTTACGRAEDQDVVRRFAGAPYMGSVKVRIVVPGDSRGGRKESGKGSAQLIDQGRGLSRLVVDGQIRDPADAGFVAEGVSDKTGWKSRTRGVLLSIGADGKISGGGIEPPHRLRFGGSVTKERFDLTVDFELLESSENGLPAGTRLVYTYALEHNAGKDGDAGKGNRSTEDDDCERIIWQTRSFADFSGGMHMTQVPVCVGR